MRNPNEQTPEALIVGAYAAAPSLIGWDPEAEGRYLDAILALDGVVGLEVPFTGSLHKYDEDWFLNRLPAGVELVLTTLPGTMARLRESPEFGLASTDDSGRNAALAFANQARAAIHKLNDALGRRAVTAVEFHSAPRAADGGSSPDSLMRSLSEIGSWDWAGAGLVLEHCDAVAGNRAAAKGFLPLEAEIDAVRSAAHQSGPHLGMAINWGRSVIEQRNPEAAAQQIRLVRQVGLLDGLIFSGCAAVNTRYGPAWADVHLPPAPSPRANLQATLDHDGSNGDFDAQMSFLERDSLLTPRLIHESMQASGPGRESGFRGVKVAAPPNATTEDRIRAVTQAVVIVQQAIH